MFSVCLFTGGGVPVVPNLSPRCPTVLVGGGGFPSSELLEFLGGGVLSSGVLNFWSSWGRQGPNFYWGTPHTTPPPAHSPPKKIFFCFFGNFFFLIFLGGFFFDCYAWAVHLLWSRRRTVLFHMFLSNQSYRISPSLRLT